jgi:hypothetical protein
VLHLLGQEGPTTKEPSRYVLCKDTGYRQGRTERCIHTYGSVRMRVGFRQRVAVLEECKVTLCRAHNAHRAHNAKRLSRSVCVCVVAEGVGS